MGGPTQEAKLHWRERANSRDCAATQEGRDVLDPDVVVRRRNGAQDTSGQDRVPDQPVGQHVVHDVPVMGLDLSAFRMLEIKNGDWTLVPETGS